MSKDNQDTIYDEFLEACKATGQYNDRTLSKVRYHAASNSQEDPIIVAAEMGIKFVDLDDQKCDPIVYAMENGMKLQPLPADNDKKEEIDPIKYAVENNLKIEGKNALDFLLNTDKGKNFLKTHTEEFLKKNNSKDPKVTQDNFLKSIGINKELKDPNLAKRILNKVSFGKLFKESVAKKEALEYLKNHKTKRITPVNGNSVDSTVIAGRGNKNRHQSGQAR